MKHARVLIADDDRSITEGLSAILRDEGYDVEVAIDGQKALDQLGAERFGVVLADLKMPKVDGLALLKELQQRSIPTECIIVTGQARSHGFASIEPARQSSPRKWMSRLPCKILLS